MTNTNFRKTIETRQAAVRAAGKLIVALIESNAGIDAIVSPSGHVNGLDIGPRAAITFSGVSQKRMLAALHNLPIAA